MHACSKEEIAAWCGERQIVFDSSGNPYFPDGAANDIRLLLPSEPHRLPHLIVSLLDLNIDEFDEVHGAELLFWLHSWDVWPKLATSIGLVQFEAVRKGFGIVGELADKPGILFTGMELKELVACPLVPLIVGWDSYLFPMSGQYFVFFKSRSVGWSFVPE